MKTKKAISIKPERLKFYEDENGFSNYQRIYYLKEGLRVYRMHELHVPAMEKIILHAQKQYVALCEKHIKKHGDGGSVIMGKGLFVAVKPPGRRNVFKLQICHPRGQGDGPAYAAQSQVLSFLFENGVDAWYEHGHMD